MCGHGTIGVVATLAYLGRIGPGLHRIETPVGIVGATLNEDGTVTIENVPSYRWAAAVELEVPGYGKVTGDVAYGGNWFFLAKEHPYAIDCGKIWSNSSLSPGPFARRSPSTRFKVRRAQKLTTSNFTALRQPRESIAGTLCSARARSTTARPAAPAPAPSWPACYAEGLLAPGEVWRQESVIGSVFEGRFALREGKLLPSITGSAFVTADSTLILDPRDAFCWGIGAL